MPPRGFKRSRALWDAVHHQHSTTWPETIRTTAAAVAYELQPVRFSTLDLQGWCHRSWEASAFFFCSAVKAAKTLLHTLEDGHTNTSTSGTSTSVIRKLATATYQRLTWNHAKWITGILLYYAFVRWIHHLLDAGPLVIIITVLTLIFTVGLSDEERRGLSAYSVFNRGFERILGTLDADDLVRQHLGGGAAAMMDLGGGRGGHGNFDEDNEDHGAQQHQHQRQRRIEQNARQDRAPVEDDRRNNQGNDDNQNGDENANGNANVDVRPADHNRARRSNKKSRGRQNNEQRMELRRQREAAAAMGFAGNDAEQVEAMNRLIEDI